MYYYALIDPTTYICYEVIESETQITEDPYCIQIDSYDRSYIIRKRYENGEWVDNNPIDVQSMQASAIGIGEEWLDSKIYSMEDTIENHTHSTATTSTAGFMSASDKTKLDGMVLATVSEVETYLAI